MNAYTTVGQAKINRRDMENILYGDAFLAGTALAAFERQRGWQAEAERDRLLKQHGVGLNAAAPLAAMLRQAVGAALVRAGERFAGGPRTAGLPGTASVTGTLGPAS